MSTPVTSTSLARLLLPVAALALGAGACRSAAPTEPAVAPVPAAAAAAPTAAEEVSAAPESAGDEKSYDNTIKWTTASELNNFGFDVYRSESADGPFERINPEVIEGGGTVDEPRSYRYVDDTIDPRQTYYYYVESISMSGAREQFTPIGRAAPKIPGEDEAGPEEGGGG